MIYDKTKKQTAFSVSKASFAMGGVGAVIGAVTAAAKNIPMAKNDEIDRTEAVKNILKESVGVGLATAAGTVVAATIMPRSGFFSLLGFATVATGTKVLLDKMVYSDKSLLPAKKSESKPDNKKEPTAKKKE